MTRSMHDIDRMVVKPNKVLHVIAAPLFELPRLLVTQTKNSLWYNSLALKGNYLAAVPQPGKEMTAGRLTEGWNALMEENNCIHIMSPDMSFLENQFCDALSRIPISPKNSKIQNSWGNICLKTTHLYKQTVLATTFQWLTFNTFQKNKKSIHVIYFSFRSKKGPSNLS